MSRESGLNLFAAFLVALLLIGLVNYLRERRPIRAALLRRATESHWASPRLWDRSVAGTWHGTPVSIHYTEDGGEGTFSDFDVKLVAQIETPHRFRVGARLPGALEAPMFGGYPPVMTTSEPVINRSLWVYSTDEAFAARLLNADKVPELLQRFVQEYGLLSIEKGRLELRHRGENTSRDLSSMEMLARMEWEVARVLIPLLTGAHLLHRSP